MPAHLHPAPACTEKIGSPCPPNPTLCAHRACSNGGRLLFCERTVGGKFYCFHSEYYLGSDVLPDTYKPNLATAKLPTPLPPVPSPPTDPIEIIANKFKGTYDLAGAAMALYESPYVHYFWSNGGSGLTDAKTKEELYAVREMCCYEFVHFAAYLAGQQRVSGGGALMVGASGGSVYPKYGKSQIVVWDRETVVPRGKLFVGVALAFNNDSGFYHVAISLGNNMVIGLDGTGKVNIRQADNVFNAWGYDYVLITDYNWAGAQGDHGAPLPVPYYQAKKGVSTTSDMVNMLFNSSMPWGMGW